MNADAIQPNRAGAKPKYKRIAYLALRGALALAFLGSGLFKLSGHPAVIAEYNQVGFGQWLRYVTAAMEVTGATLLVIPRTIMFGAALLAALCVAAMGAQLLFLHGDFIHAIVLAIVLGLIARHEFLRPSSQR